MRVVIVTYLPSPYQIELCDALDSAKEFDLNVVYLSTNSPTPIARNWQIRDLRHNFVALTRGSLTRNKATDLIRRADFVVFNYYQHRDIRRWMKVCEENRVPWCFWGERLGFTRLALLGHLYRRVRLQPLRNSCAAIWGIGQWAVERYRAEFGNKRSYFNIPYFSDLGRFSERSSSREFYSQNRRFLFSGSLIERKGVDLLGKTFTALAQEFPNVTLTLVGAGNLEKQLRRQFMPLADRVRLLGFQSWQDLPSHYSNSDILCAPSRYDGWALVVPEAMASGLPVIGTDCTGAAREFVRDGKNGLLIPAGQETPLLEALRRAAAWTGDELRSFSEAARESVREHSLDDGVKRFISAVHQSTVRCAT